MAGYTIGIKELRGRNFGSKRELCEYLNKFLKAKPSCARVYRVNDGQLIPTNHVVAVGTYGRLVVMEQKLCKGEGEFLRMVVNRSLLNPELVSNK